MPLLLILIFLILLEVKISQLKVTAMAFEIQHPEPPKYFIGWDLDGDTKINIAYGLTETMQCTTVSREYCETFELESEYLARLAEFGINSNEEEVIA